MTIRVAGYFLLVLLVLVLAPPAGHAGELRIAAWNLEHLDDSDGEGCVGRDGADYAALARRIADLGADVVALQEVENASAAHRVFPASDWHIEMSGRPPKVRSRACWGKPEARLGHLATGFAIRRGVAYRRNVDLDVLGAGDAFQRWGTDVTVMAGGREGKGSRSACAIQTPILAIDRESSVEGSARRELRAAKFSLERAQRENDGLRVRFLKTQGWKCPELQTGRRKVARAEAAVESAHTLYAADWTIDQLRAPAQCIADRIEALANADETGAGKAWRRPPTLSFKLPCTLV